MTGVRALDLTLEVTGYGVRVSYRVEGADFAAGSTVAHLPAYVVGVPTIRLGDAELEVEDLDGPVEVRSAGEGWHTTRATRGPVRVTYPARARPVDATTADGHPPIELRREAGGVSGEGSTFLALPPLAGDWHITLTWDGVSSFPASDAADGGLLPLQALLDCLYMAGEVTTVGDPVRVHYLTRPVFDAEAFAGRTGRMHRALASVFRQSAPPFQIFLRHNPYRGMSGSADPGAFSVGWNEDTLDSADRLDAFIDHEIVHEWVQVDGDHEEAVWLNEGVADYYGIVLPYRAGILPEETFLLRVNLQARFTFASPYRGRPLDEVAPHFWRDFRARQEPYHRGFLYFAHLELALRERGSDLGELMAERRSFTPATWLDLVAAELGPRAGRLRDDVLRGSVEPPPGTVWGAGFECHLREAPVIDPGFDAVTFITGTVTGLRPGGAAEQSGLREGDVLVSLPTYNALVMLPPGEQPQIRVRRGSSEFTVAFRTHLETTLVPTWQRA